MPSSPPPFVPLFPVGLAAHGYLTPCSGMAASNVGLRRERRKMAGSPDGARRHAATTLAKAESAVHVLPARRSRPATVKLLSHKAGVDCWREEPPPMAASVPLSDRRNALVRPRAVPSAPGHSFAKGRRRDRLG